MYRDRQLCAEDVDQKASVSLALSSRTPHTLQSENRTKNEAKSVSYESHTVQAAHGDNEHCHKIKEGPSAKT